MDAIGGSTRRASLWADAGNKILPTFGMMDEVMASEGDFVAGSQVPE
jgi:hypothetical protein